jgi:hypothetical protein
MITDDDAIFHEHIILFVIVMNTAASQRAACHSSYLWLCIVCDRQWHKCILRAPTEPSVRPLRTASEALRRTSRSPRPPRSPRLRPSRRRPANEAALTCLMHGHTHTHTHTHSRIYQFERQVSRKQQCTHIPDPVWPIMNVSLPQSALPEAFRII